MRISRQVPVVQVNVKFTQSLLKVYSKFTQSLRKVYARYTQCMGRKSLRKSLRKVYAQKFGHRFRLENGGKTKKGTYCSGREKRVCVIIVRKKLLVFRGLFCVAYCLGQPGCGQVVGSTHREVSKNGIS